MGFTYHIYGLNIRSSRQIKLLKEIQAADANLVVEWHTYPSEKANSELQWERVITPELASKDNIRFFRADSAEGVFHQLLITPNDSELSFVLSPQKDILWITYAKDEAEFNLDSFFVGIIMGFVLRLRGVLCLHASAVEIAGRAVLLLGKKKSGKSTTAATFSKMGYRILTDDVAAISIHNGMYYVEPGYPKVRLRRQPLAVIHPQSDIQDDLSLVFSHRDTRYSEVSNNFSDKALPLGAIYLLGEADADDAIPTVEPIGAERLIRLHENTFAGYVITPAQRRQEFEQLSKLALHAPIRRVRFGHTVNMAHLQCEAIIADFDQK